MNQISRYAASAYSFLCLHRHAALSTISVAESGYPFGSVVPYDIDSDGQFFIYISKISEHFRNLQSHPQACLLVTDPFVIDDQQAFARASVILDFEPVPDLETEQVLTSYQKRFPKSESYKLSHDFVCMKGVPLRIRWIGGFGDIGWIRPEAFLALAFDSVRYAALPGIQHMNVDHHDALVDFVKAHSEFDVQGAHVMMVDAGSENFRLRVFLKSGIAHEITIPFLEPLSGPEDFRTGIIAALKEARKNIG